MAFAENDWSQPGRWRLDIDRLQRALALAFAPLNDPRLPNALAINMQVADLQAWGDIFGTLGGSARYVRGSRTLHVSVQVDYPKVKRLNALTQLKRTFAALAHSVQSAERTLQVPNTVSLELLSASLRTVLAGIELKSVLARSPRADTS
jgi:hypothetical protein